MILKWAGGKRAIMSSILELMPKDWTGRRYFEPFVGGAAVFFELAGRGAFDEATIGDVLPSLVAVYTEARDRPEALIERLALLASLHGPEHYRHVRDAFNMRLLPEADAARMVYLNRTCFNGLWRTNAKGEFNTPIGSYKNPKICDAAAIRDASGLLKLAKIVCADFEDSTRDARAGDVVYLDPPYVPISKTANFTGYAGGFGMAEQERLAAHCRELARRGCVVIASNSDTPEVRRMYSGFVLHEVQAPRRLSCKTNRKPVGELLITNG